MEKNIDKLMAIIFTITLTVIVAIIIIIPIKKE